MNTMSHFLLLVFVTMLLSIALFPCLGKLSFETRRGLELLIHRLLNCIAKRKLRRSGLLLRLCCCFLGGLGVLNYLFLSGSAPALPGPSECGIDPTLDELDCTAFVCR
jgi:hypothetical protein